MIPNKPHLLKLQQQNPEKYQVPVLRVLIWDCVVIEDIKLVVIKGVQKEKICAFSNVLKAAGAPKQCDDIKR